MSWLRQGLHGKKLFSHVNEDSFVAYECKEIKLRWSLAQIHRLSEFFPGIYVRTYEIKVSWNSIHLKTMQFSVFLTNFWMFTKTFGIQPVQLNSGKTEQGVLKWEILANLYSWLCYQFNLQYIRTTVQYFQWSCVDSWLCSAFEA